MKLPKKTPNRLPSRSQKALSQKLTLEMLQKNFEKLNDHFLEFDINEMTKYFDKKTWLSVKKLYNEKKVHSLSSICDEFCKSSCICCTTCNFCVLKFQFIIKKANISYFICSIRLNPQGDTNWS